MDTGAWVLSSTGLEDGVATLDMIGEDEGMIVATGEEVTTRIEEETGEAETTGG